MKIREEKFLFALLSSPFGNIFTVWLGFVSAFEGGKSRKVHETMEDVRWVWLDGSRRRTTHKSFNSCVLLIGKRDWKESNTKELWLERQIKFSIISS